MNEPKDILPDLPEEEEFIQEDAPAPAAEPAPEDGDDPVEVPEPEPEIDPKADPEPDPEPEPEVEPEAAPEPEPEADLAPGPDDVAEVGPSPDDHDDLFEDPRDLGPAEAFAASEADLPGEAAAEPLSPVESDDFGPEPWDDAPASDWARAKAPDPDPEPAPAPAPVEIAPVAIAGGVARGASELPTDDVKRTAFAVYLLYLGTPIFLGLSPILGAWLAMRSRAEAPEWVQSHYQFQIRTFWISLATTFAAFTLVFLPFALGPTLAIALFVWVVARCFVGMVRLHRGEPIFHPETWMV